MCKKLVQVPRITNHESRFTFHVSRFTFHLGLLICLLTTSLAGAGCRSDGIGVRSWDEAIGFVQTELEEAGDIESRLEGYASTATDLSAKIELLDQARPALEMINQLRDVHVPLVGNGWQILLALLSLATVDGAKIIARLEEILRTLAELKGSLDSLAGLPAVAEAARAFRADPNRRTLEALSAASATTTPSMTRLHAELGEVLEPLKDVAGNLSGLIKALQIVAAANVSVVSDVARQAVERIGVIEEPLLTLRDDLDQLHQDIGADVKVLENIQEAARQAQEHGE
jgi:uncharacterized protein (UPF0335 family)